MKSLKSIILTFVAALALMATPSVFALDPHEVKSTTTTAYSTTTTATPQTLTIATITLTGCNSGTNSYVFTANIDYDVPSGNAVSFQISKGGTLQGTAVKVSNQGTVTISATAEAVADASVITIQAIGKTTGTPVNVSRATLTCVGAAGATQ